MNATVDRLKAIVGPGAWVTDPEALQPHLTEWRGRLHGSASVMLLPKNTAEVAEILRVCASTRTAVVPQGGNTGMCGGAIPDESGTQVIVNLRRMNRIRQVDALNFSLVADAGCVLADVQAAAREVGRMFPLSLGGEGSCQIGGNLATNAGGINVLRYGTARDLTLGVEVVLADGTIWDGIRTLRKNTAGYDLKQLFIGSEGTLGIITGVAVKLFPDPGHIRTAFLALATAQQAIELLAEFRTRLPESVQAFELISKRALSYVARHIPDVRLPLDDGYPWYVLLDVAIPDQSDALERLLQAAIDRGMVTDAVLAKNVAEAEQLWRVRHSISEAEKREGRGIKHDIAVPIGRMPEFLVEASRRLTVQVPEAIPVVFGHVGDGNLHYNAHLPAALQGAEFDRLALRVTTVIYELVQEVGGSISAEHGIGVFKRDALAQYSDPAELQLMRTLKQALDPANILNPGKVI